MEEEEEEEENKDDFVWERAMTTLEPDANGCQCPY